jgi:hypothetical protein
VRQQKGRYVLRLCATMFETFASSFASEEQLQPRDAPFVSNDYVYCMVKLPSRMDRALAPLVVHALAAQRLA